MEAGKKVCALPVFESERRRALVPGGYDRKLTGAKVCRETGSDAGGCSVLMDGNRVAGKEFRPAAAKDRDAFDSGMTGKKSSGEAEQQL